MFPETQRALSPCLAHLIAGGTTANSGFDITEKKCKTKKSSLFLLLEKVIRYVLRWYNLDKKVNKNSQTKGSLTQGDMQVQGNLLDFVLKAQKLGRVCRKRV